MDIMIVIYRFFAHGAFTCLQVVYRLFTGAFTGSQLFTGCLQAVYRLFTVLHYSDTITESHYCASQGWQIRDTRIIRNTDSERIIRELILGRGASSQNTDFSRPESNEIKCRFVGM